MAIELSELRLEQVQEAVAFARKRGGAVEAEAVTWTLSHLARQDGALLAVALCHQEAGDPVLEIVIDAATADPQDLARLLVDKTLLKVQARGLHKCAIRIRAEQGEQLLWPAATWIGDAA